MGGAVMTFHEPIGSQSRGLFSLTITSLTGVKRCTPVWSTCFLCGSACLVGCDVHFL